MSIKAIDTKPPSVENCPNSFTVFLEPGEVFTFYHHYHRNHCFLSLSLHRYNYHIVFSILVINYIVISFTLFKKTRR